MFDKLDFSDFNKFIVSVGIILLTLAFIIPWFFFKDVSNFQIAQSSFDSLTNVSKNFVYRREKIIDWLFIIIPIASSVFSLSGVSLIYWGLKRWFIKQTEITDKIDQLNILKLQQEIKPLSKEEKKQNILADNILLGASVNKINELALNENAEIDLNDKEKCPPPKIGDIIVEDAIVENALAVEEIVMNRIVSKNLFEYEIKRDVKIGNQFPIDILMQSRLKEIPDKIFEIKYFNININFESIYSKLIELNKLRLLYNSNYQKVAFVYFMVIYRDGVVDGNTVQRFQSVISKYINERKIVDIHFQMMNRNQLEHYQFDDIFSK